MRTINRSVIIVKPREPYLEWAHKVAFPDYTTLKDLQTQSAAILIPLTAYEAGSVERYLQERWARIFEMELEAWCSNQSLWPSDRNREMFTSWFDIEAYALVIDDSEEAFCYDLY